MKKKFFAFAAVCAAMMLSLSIAIAQNPTSSVPAENIGLADRTGDPSYHYLNSPATVRPKLMRDFLHRYKTAVVPVWLSDSHGSYAKFTEDSVTNVIHYNNYGNWMYQIKTYHEFKAPRNVRDIVKSVYYDYAIAWVKEVETIESEGVPTYIFFVENSNEVKLVRVYADKMDILNEYTKL